MTSRSKDCVAVNFWVTLADFTVKMQNWEENPYLTENRLSKNELCCAADNHKIIFHSSTQYLDFTFNKQVFTKYRFFYEITQNTTYQQTVRNFQSINNIIGG